MGQIFIIIAVGKGKINSRDTNMRPGRTSRLDGGAVLCYDVKKGGIGMEQKIGCVIMASGMARRFGSNKLLHEFRGAPIITRILDTMEQAPLAARVVVTRHWEIKEICDQKGIPVILHDLPEQSDTVRLGVEHLLGVCPEMTGCMFAASDQPCLTAESVAKLCRAFAVAPENIWRLAWQGTVGNPVLFPASTFEELLRLPVGKGGGAVVKKHPKLVRTVEVGDERELIDVDTPEILARLLER